MEGIVNWGRHTLDDESFGEPVIVVASVRLTHAWKARFPTGKVIPGDTEHDWRIPAFTKCFQGGRRQVMQGKVPLLSFRFLDEGRAGAPRQLVFDHL